MRQFLLDSNIVIYILNKDIRVISFLEKFKKAIFSISIVTWIEVLAGSAHHNKSIPELAQELVRFPQIPLHVAIGLTAASLMQENIRNKRKQRFRDCSIAATALVHKMPLITNNPKDFHGIKGLTIIAPK